MVIAIIIISNDNNNNSNKVDLQTEKHHRKKTQKNRQTSLTCVRYLSGKHGKKLFHC